MRKRFSALLLALVLTVGLLPTAAWAAPQAANIASGTDWVLDADGKLTISSDAGMQSWSSFTSTYKDSVTSVEIKGGVTSIGRSAFNGCTALASITIPGSVTSIGDYAFRGCTALTNITVPESVTSIGDYAFWNCAALTSITIPENAKVTTIGTSAFSDCSRLTSITIPESVTSIGNSAFYYCTSLASITIPENAKVTSIGEKVFSLCVSLTSITIPESVTSIGSSAFKNCEALASITIPKSVTSIGSSAFSTCRALTTVTMLPETPPKVETDAFSNCKFVKDQTIGIHAPEGTEQAYKTAWQAWADYITDGTQKSDHNHPVCGNDCGHNGAHEVVPWKALNQDSFTGGENGKPKAGSGVTLDGSIYKLAEGHYFLNGNINIDKSITIKGGTVNLCLNGHTLTNTSSVILNAIGISSNATLNLCDCGSGGKITASGASRLLDIEGYNDVFANLYGGTVDNPTGICVETRGNLVLDGATLKAGGEYVINAQAASTVTINSGMVEGKTRNCVQMSSSATFAMTGGTVTNTGSGNGLYIVEGSATVSGGTIHSQGGAGIYLSGNSFTLSGAPVITGGEAGITLYANSSITVGKKLTGSYTVFRANWRATQDPNNQYEITEAKPYAFTTAASADHSEHFTAATKMTGIAVRNSGTGSSQQVQLYMPHNWSLGWTKNETHHWHICHNSAEGNCTITDYTACGEAGAAYGAHQWAYETNSYQHRQKCTVCGYTENSWTPHTWTDDHDLDCNVCGYQRSVPLYGTVTVTGTPKLGVPLTAAVTGAPSGVALKYAWTAAGSSAVLGTASTYTPTASEVGKTLTVTVTTGDARYTGSLTAATAAVAKGDQDAPSQTLFTVADANEGQSNGSITISEDVDKLEYRAKPTDDSDPAWIDASRSRIDTLPAGTYEFRYKETATHNASPASEVQVCTLTAEAKTLSIAPGIAHGTVTKQRDKVNPGDTVTLAVQPHSGYKLTAIAANCNDGGNKTITPTVKPDNAQQYTFQMPNADVTVTATFSPVTYTIDYQWEGVADGSFTVETTGLTLANPTRTGYTLSGWAFAEGGPVIANVTAAALMGQAVERTVKLYPVWVEGETPPSHTHAWATAWTTNATHHWHNCTADCPIIENSGKNGYAAHTEDNGTVTTLPTGTDKGVKTYKCTVCERVLRTEDIPAQGFSVSGKVTDHEGNAVGGATVKLKQGSTVIKTATTDSEGNYSFANVPADTYNVVAEKDSVTKTILVELTDADATQKNIQMPEGKTNSVVEVKGENTPAVVVGGVDRIAEAQTVNSGETVTVKLTVEKKAENAAANAEEIKREASGKTVEFLDLKLQKTVTGGTNDGTTDITDTQGKVLEIVVPYDFSGKTDVTVYRYHDNKAETLTLAQDDSKTGGTFKLGTDSVIIYATKFSTYAIGYTAASQTQYTLTVIGGTGGGSYAAGTTVNISATVPSGKQFTGWTGATVANPNSINTTLTMPAQNTTVTANFQTIPSGGGGGWSGPTTYTVETPSADGGKVAASPKNAASGTTVTLTLTPDEGYEIGGITVTDRNGKQIAVTNKGDGKYTFTMPSGKVTVTGTFTKIAGGYQDCPRDSTCPIWPYTDTNLAAWYHDGIHYCVENGLMNGYGNGLFGPNDNLTRAQFAQLLHNREGRPVVNYLLRFEDVPNGAWYTEAVRWAAAQGVVSGYGNGKFGPDDPITREQLAVMLWRYVGSPAATKKELRFTDAGKASGYALEALHWAVEHGIINGYGDGRLDPRGLATRAQVAQMLKNFLDK